jgi:gamma-glutamyltranspeptidase/glutathione hydrolase
MVAAIAAGHPDTARLGLEMLAAGGSAADAAVAAVLASCVSESIYTGINGGGFATYYDAGTRTVTALDFFCTIPGLDGDVTAGPMVAIDVLFGAVPVPYSIGEASVAVPGVPAGCGEVHRRWGRLPWQQVVAPAIGLARQGVAMPAAQAASLATVAPALLPGIGASIYSRNGKLLEGGDLLHHPGLDIALTILAEEGPAAFYTGRVGELLVETVRSGGGTIGPRDLAEYRVLSVPVEHADIGDHRAMARRDLSGTIATIDALPAAVADLAPPDRAVALARALLAAGPQKVGDTTNISVVDATGNACIVTTTLGIGAGVWLPGLGVHLNSMLGEGELFTDEVTPGKRMSSNMCPLVVLADDGELALAAGSAGGSRIRTALVQTLVNVLLDGDDLATAIDRPRFHPVRDGAGGPPVVHVEPGYPPEHLAALASAGFVLNQWERLNPYFGGVSAVGRSQPSPEPRRPSEGEAAAQAAGDPRRGGVGLLL